MSTNLPRVVQKIFGANADTDDAIAQFGSVIAGQPTFTGDIEEIQALNAWKNGWVGSTITNKRYPTSEETTGINKVVTQQIAYILQKGLPEWSAEETYYTNSFCQMDGTIYISLTDNNIGNIPTASINAWRLYEINNSVTRSIGELAISPIPLIEAGLHLLDGALLDGNGIYSEFVDYIVRRYSDDDKIPNANLIGYIRQDNGILSNFSADGYATLPSTFSPNTNTWEFITKINIASIGANNNILASETNQYVSFYVNSQGYLTFNLGDGSAWISGDISGSTLLSIDTDYYVKLEFDGTKYTSYYSTDNEVWTQEASYTGSISMSNATLLLGIGRNIQAPLSGTIDLNASYINIDNKRWWSGMRTSWIVDESVWQSSITNYGVCGKFVYDPTANTVRLPKITGIIEGTTDLSALGDLVEAGLPNHNHTLTADVWRGADGSTQRVAWDGGDRKIGSATATVSWASNSNSIYGNSPTVQPQTIKLMFYICVANSTKTDIEVDIDEIATDLNGKADRDLTNTAPTSAFASVLNSVNIVTATDIYVSGYSGYIQFADGTLIQWGRLGSVSHRTNTEITLLKSYTSQNFAVLTSCRQLGFVGTSTISAEPSANNKIIIYQSNSANVTMNCGWMTIGK